MFSTEKLATLTGGAAAIAMALVMAFEGYRIHAYRDPVGIPTICYGHTASVKMGQVKTKEECEALLEGDLGIAMQAVDTYVTVPLPETRRAALASFTYNVGAGAFKRSTLLKLLNDGHTAKACAELDKWVHAGGVKLKGLVQRRKIEREICEVGL